ncbi:carboxypeptidase-like regulatory domain-containing protein [Pedobacter sp. SYP-B3415]|uniref:carboxypeptidase-like regulatory domain-containing protein n=1 Tax=Pedobacter sp. SYP-B3415 TaxID=2496641 RepID=UPI00101CED25|nr:carboxypeptidase-like regulatory domain-containing protein [Pedobacter sp. SYP-B3415]
MLEDYLDGKLNARDMHFVERAVLDDPFVAEALEGLSKSPRRVNNLSLLQKQLHERTAQNEVKKRVWSLTWQRLSIAATAAVLFVAAGIIFWMKEDNRQRGLASNRKTVDVVLDTVKSGTRTAAKTPYIEDSMVNVAIAEAKKQALAKNKTPGRLDPQPVKGGAVPPAEEKHVVPPAARSEQRTLSIASAPEAFAARRAEVSSNYIAGKVVSEQGAPVEGVTIRIPGSQKFVMTDRDGNFSLPAVKAEKITAASVGYTAANMVATPRKPVRITLKETKNTLNDIVVAHNGNGQQQNLGSTTVLADSATMAMRSAAAGKVAAGRMYIRGKAAAALAVPAGGWEAYNQYLQSNSKFAQAKAANKLVSVTFTVDKDGRAGAFKVLLGDEDTDGAYINELIRLVRSGPPWEHHNAATSGKVTMVF